MLKSQNLRSYLQFLNVNYNAKNSYTKRINHICRHHLLQSDKRYLFNVSKYMIYDILKFQNYNAVTTSFSKPNKRSITNSNKITNNDANYHFNVETYGRLHIQTGDATDIYISPQDIEHCPNMDKVDMQVINGR